jgi:hypothetical protein
VGKRTCLTSLGQMAWLRMPIDTGFGVGQREQDWALRAGLAPLPMLQK